jgi:hypothetical protein
MPSEMTESCCCMIHVPLFAGAPLRQRFRPWDLALARQSELPAAIAVRGTTGPTNRFRLFRRGKISDPRICDEARCARVAPAVYLAPIRKPEAIGSHLAREHFDPDETSVDPTGPVTGLYSYQVANANPWQRDRDPSERTATGVPRDPQPGSCGRPRNHLEAHR